MLTAARNPKHRLTNPRATTARSLSQGAVAQVLRVPRTGVQATPNEAQADRWP